MLRLDATEFLPPKVGTDTPQTTISPSQAAQKASKPKKRSRCSRDKTIIKLTHRHRMLMRAMVLDGMKISEVATEFNITRDRLTTLRNTPLWKAEEEGMRKEALSLEKIRMESLAGKAVDALEDGLDDNDPRIRLSSAKETLDRIGMGTNDKEDTASQQTQINLYIPDSFNRGHAEKE